MKGLGAVPVVVVDTRDAPPSLGVIAPCKPEGQVHEINEVKDARCQCACYMCVVNFANRVVSTHPVVTLCTA